MLPSSYPLEATVPHRRTMLLLDETVKFDRENASLTAAFVAKREWRGGFAAIEYMAQAAAALAGSADLDSGIKGDPKPGFLLGTRRLELKAGDFEPGRRYLVSAANEFTDGEAASFRCEIRTEQGDVFATAILNAYRPANVHDFLSAPENGESVK